MSTPIYTTIGFKIGIFLFLLLVIAIKFWLTRRKYLNERTEREIIAAMRERNSTAARNSFLLIEADLRERDLLRYQVGRGNCLEIPPPPDFENAIKNSKKVDRSEDSPPTYTEYLRTISAITDLQKVDVEIPEAKSQGVSGTDPKDSCEVVISPSTLENRR